MLLINLNFKWRLQTHYWFCWWNKFFALKCMMWDNFVALSPPLTCFLETPDLPLSRCLLTLSGKFITSLHIRKHIYKPTRTATNKIKIITLDIEKLYFLKWFQQNLRSQIALHIITQNLNIKYFLSIKSQSGCYLTWDFQRMEEN